jgi:hypothetical protein
LRSHPGFWPAFAAPQQQNPRRSAATPAVLLNPRDQISLKIRRDLKAHLRTSPKSGKQAVRVLCQFLDQVNLAAQGFQLPPTIWPALRDFIPGSKKLIRKFAREGVKARME